MDVLLALGAALLFSLGTVLQQRVARQVPDEQAESAGLLVRLAKKPAWLAGMAADGAGFLCQAGALAIGRLAVVQPILATSVVFAIPLGAKLDGRRVGRRDVYGALAVTAGLAAFLVLADPGGGRDDATAVGWAVTFGLAGAGCGALVLAARGRAPAPKAALLGTATGILFGISAALTKAVVDDFDAGLWEGLGGAVGDWHLYALIVVGWISMTLSQRSLQTGALAPAVATQMSLDPIASVLLGVLAFDESIHDTTLGATAALAGIVLMVGGLAILSRAQAGSAEPPGAEPRRAAGAGFEPAG